jgi:hypothetical protein
VRLEPKSWVAVSWNYAATRELAGISVSMRQGPHQAQEREGDHQRDDEAAPVEAVKSDGFPSGNDGDLTWASGW